jgi:hypothetical protein
LAATTETINDFASGRKVGLLGLVEERVSNPAQALGALPKRHPKSVIE